MLVQGWGWVAWGTYLIAMPAGALAVRYAALRSGPVLVVSDRGRTLGRAVLAAVLAAALVLGLFAGLKVIGWATVERRGLGLPALITGVMGPQLLVATWEELTFRGALQPVAIRHLGKGGGLALASILFGLFHLPNILYHEVPALLTPLTVAALALMGLVFGLACHRDHGQLALPIALHFGWNSACFGLDELLAYRFNGPRWLVGTPAWFPESGLLGAMMLGVLGSMVWLMTSQNRRPETKTP